MQKKSIRKIENIEEFLSSIQECNYFDNWKQSEIENLINSRNYECFSVLKSGNIAGFIVFSTVIDTAEIIYVFINGAYRGEGLGFYLLTETFTVLKEEEICQVFLEVAVNNKPARRLYEKIGFEQIGIRRKYYKNKEDAITYRLNL